MRIISGKYKSRKIFSSTDKNLRPTSDRVRETLFNILAHQIEIEGMSCLDLFAGTGALGFEAMSRGAARCDFVDISRESARIIKMTAASLSCMEQIEFHKSDSLGFLWNNPGRYDIIFADPPYNFKQYNELIEYTLAREPAVFVLEHSGLIEHNPANRQLTDKVIYRTIGKTSLRIFLNRRES